MKKLLMLFSIILANQLFAEEIVVFPEEEKRAEQKMQYLWSLDLTSDELKGMTLQDLKKVFCEEIYFTDRWGERLDNTKLLSDLKTEGIASYEKNKGLRYSRAVTLNFKVIPKNK